MIGRILAPLALAAAVVAPLALVSAGDAEARPGWGHHHGGRGWGGPPRWAPAYGWRRHHRGYGFRPYRGRFGYGYGAPRYRW